MNISRRSDNYRYFIETFGGIAFRTKIGKYKPDFFHGAVKKITGYNEEDFIKGTPAWNEIVHPDDIHLLQKESEVIEKKANYCKEKSYRIIHKNGSIRWVRETIKVTPDEKGQPCYLSGTIFDITELKAVEENYLENARFLENIFSAIQDGICVIDKDLKIVKVNRAMKEYYSHCAPILGKTCSEVYNQDCSSDSWCPAEKSLADGKIHNKIIPYFSDGDSKGWMQVFSFPMKNSSGKIEGVIEHVKDISKRMHAEASLKRSILKLRGMLDGGISAIAKLVEKRDPYTSGHQQRVTELAVAIAKAMGIKKDRIDCIRTSSIIHDIGKMYIPAEILGKPSKLNNLEFNLIREHPSAAYDVLKEIDFPWPVADIVLQHHERMDGSGYPHGLTGNDICQEAQIIAVADSIEAMTSHRPYRPAMDLEKSLKELAIEKEGVLNREIVETCSMLFLEKKFNFSIH